MVALNHVLFNDISWRRSHSIAAMLRPKKLSYKLKNIYILINRTEITKKRATRLMLWPLVLVITQEIWFNNIYRLSTNDHTLIWKHILTDMFETYKKFNVSETYQLDIIFPFFPLLQSILVTACNKIYFVVHLHVGQPMFWYETIFYRKICQ